jgi:hypothetical protein
MALAGDNRALEGPERYTGKAEMVDTLPAAGRLKAVLFSFFGRRRGGIFMHVSELFFHALDVMTSNNRETVFNGIDNTFHEIPRQIRYIIP